MIVNDISDRNDSQLLNYDRNERNNISDISDISHISDRNESHH